MLNIPFLRCKRYLFCRRRRHCPCRRSRLLLHVAVTVDVPSFSVQSNVLSIYRISTAGEKKIYSPISTCEATKPKCDDDRSDLLLSPAPMVLVTIFCCVCFIFISFSFLSMLDLHYVLRRLCAPSKCSDSMRSHTKYWIEFDIFLLFRLTFIPLSLFHSLALGYSYSIYHFILSSDKMKWQTSNQKARERKNNNGRLNQWAKPGLEAQQTPLTHKRTHTHTNTKKDMRQSKPEVIWCQSKHGNYIMF